MTTKDIGIDEMLEIARKGRPNVTYTKNRRGDAIAALVNDRWCMVAGKLIDGRWAHMGDLLVNGEPVNKQEDWLTPECGKGVSDAKA